MAYTCSRCGRKARLPDFCCGQAMVAEGTYYCKNCGSTAASPANCCGQPMLLA